MPEGPGRVSGRCHPNVISEFRLCVAWSGGISGGAAHGGYVDGDGEEDDDDCHDHDPGWKYVVLGADGLDDEVLQGGEEADGFSGEPGDHVLGDALKAGAVLGGDADGIVKCAGVAADEGHHRVEKDCHDGKQKEHFGLAPGIGLAVEAEVSWDAVGEMIGAVDGAPGEPEEEGEGDEGDGVEEFAHLVFCSPSPMFADQWVLAQWW